MDPKGMQPRRLVSIITPVLNRANSISAVLASVGAQTYRPIEHLIVDGGSTDGTVQAIEAFSQSISSVRWISEPDSGMYEAIEKGVRMAKGNVFAYLNSDDLYFPWSVEVAVRRLERGCDFVFGDVAIIEENDTESSFRLQFYRDFDIRYYIHHGVLAQPTVFWTRKAMEAVGAFDANRRLLGDVDYWTRAALSGLRFCHLDEVLALVMMHPGTLSVRFADQMQEELASIRSSVAAQAVPPQPRIIMRARESLSWRIRQFALRREAKREIPRRWPRFIGLLRELHIEVRGSGVLLFLLPGRLLRRQRTLNRMLDSPEEFQRRFLANLQAQINNDRVEPPVAD